MEQRFNSALLKSIEESIAAFLSRDTSSAYHVYGFLGLSREEIPAHLKEFFDALTRLFGVSGEVLGRRIIRRLYEELGLSFVQKPNGSLVDHVDDARRMFLDGLRSKGAASKLG